MDVTVAKRDFLRHVSRCQGVADKKSTVPYLSNVLLSADAGMMRVAATDLHLAVTGELTGEVTRPGSVAVPARDLLERVKAMPEGSIRVTSDGAGATELRGVGHARQYRLVGMSGSDFPGLPRLDPDAPTLDLGVDVLSNLIQRTHFSILADESRAHLNCALFECSGSRVRMVTTDGHRLSKMEATAPGVSATATMLIPMKAVHELRRLCDEARSDKEAGTITVAQSGPNAFFRAAGTLFCVKLVDAQFPPYQQVIPAQTTRSLRAPRLSLSEALRAVALAASDRTFGVRLAVSDGGVMRITSESPETGAALDEVAVEYAGPEVTIGFNARYLLDVLGAIDEEEIVLGISGELDPAVIKPATESSEASYIAVIMPMRI